MESTASLTSFIRLAAPMEPLASTANTMSAPTRLSRTFTRRSGGRMTRPDCPPPRLHC